MDLKRVNIVRNNKPYDLNYIGDQRKKLKNRGKKILPPSNPYGVSVSKEDFKRKIKLWKISRQTL